MQYLFGAILLVHGVAHVVGFVVPWRIVSHEEVPYKTTIFAGAVDLGDFGIRVMGALWLATAIAFMVVAIAALLGASWWFPIACIVTMASLLMTIAGLPESRIGVAVNLALLAALGTTAYFAWRVI